MGITKENAVKIAINEAKSYKKKLAGTILLVIYRDRIDNQLKFLEIEFFPHHYQHLTGLLLTEVDKKTGERKIREFTENIDKAAGNGTAVFAAKAIEIYCK